MWYIKNSPAQLADIRYIINGEERETKDVQTRAKNFSEAKEIMVRDFPEAELTYFHILTESEMLERQTVEWNRVLRDPEDRGTVCAEIAEALKVIGRHEKAFLEQVLATEQSEGNKEINRNGINSITDLDRYSDWSVAVTALRTAIRILPFLDTHRERISEVCAHVEDRRKALEAASK